MSRTPMEGTPNQTTQYVNGASESLGLSAVALRATSAGNLVLRFAGDAAGVFLTHPVGSGDYISGQIAEIDSSSTANCVVFYRA